MRRHATKILLLAKISAGFAVPALIMAGLTRLRWRRWFPVVFLGETLWTGTLVVFGFLATEAIVQVERSVRIVALVVSAILLVFIFYILPRAVRHSDLLGVAEAELGIRAPESSS
jgi:membrane protein DedA with SNARE-associated domain